MIQNVLVTGVTPLCNTNEIHCWENRPFSTIWPEDQPKAGKITRTIKKKPKRIRTAFSTDQLRALERSYSRHKYIDTERRRELASSLNIGEKCVKVWFQNRRMKEKKESSESSSESSNETREMSPPLPQVEPTQNQNNYIYYDPYYQLPYFYPYIGNTSCANAHEIPSAPTGSANDIAFYNEVNVYPTQYYPSVDQNVDAQYTDSQNYWSSNNNDIHYF
ncbi:homeobox protein pnx [Manduca sexta]|uniref:Homeobox domain-containing protein n=1 Tax=Manduca sexta TaxID=7130 RepID=A0A921ZA66_MANSE|nr:homeobox protein pnx [Manduca sexta]KAG6453353.1 hypothetical protein O3G_MSEX008103 [Manduca sexta]KAG6453354.1 hypothetical protein O3G_MSEX008103 [Manduca sexta]